MCRAKPVISSEVDAAMPMVRSACLGIFMVYIVAGCLPAIVLDCFYNDGKKVYG